MKTVVKSTSLISFFGLAYGISWLIWSPYYLPLGLSLNALPYVHLLGSLGPMLAALLLTAAEQGSIGVQHLFGPPLNSRHSIRWLGIAFLAPFCLLALIIGYICVTQHYSPNLTQLFTSGEFSFLPTVVYILVNVIVFGLGEEVGWRGFALPRLQTQYSAFISTLILTGFWAIWHWPLFLNPLGGYIHMDIAGIGGWLFSLVIGGMLFTWLFNSSRGSVWVCALFHGLMDVVFMVDLGMPQLPTYTALLLTLGCVYVSLVYKPANLSPSPKVTIKPA